MVIAVHGLPVDDTSDSAAGAVSIEPDVRSDAFVDDLEPAASSVNKLENKINKLFAKCTKKGGCGAGLFNNGYPSYGLGGLHGAGLYGSGLYGSGLYGSGLYGSGLYGSGLYGSGLYGSGLYGSGLYGSGLYGSGLYGSGLYGSGLYGSGLYGSGLYGGGLGGLGGYGGLYGRSGDVVSEEGESAVESY